MSRTKIAITIDPNTLEELDRLVIEKIFSNRSQAIQTAIDEKLGRLRKNRLAIQCAKLNPEYEKALAEEGLSEELGEWPEY